MILTIYFPFIQIIKLCKYFHFQERLFGILNRKYIRLRILSVVVTSFITFVISFRFSFTPTTKIRACIAQKQPISTHATFIRAQIIRLSFDRLPWTNSQQQPSHFIIGSETKKSYIQSFQVSTFIVSDILCVVM